MPRRCHDESRTLRAVRFHAARPARVRVGPRAGPGVREGHGPPAPGDPGGAVRGGGLRHHLAGDLAVRLRHRARCGARERRDRRSEAKSRQSGWDRSPGAPAVVMYALALALPSSSHFIYIPIVFLIGIVIGFIVGSKATRDAIAFEQKKAAEREARKAERAARQSAAQSDK